MDDILDKIPEQFNMADIMAKVEERTPYVIVAFQVIIYKVTWQAGLNFVSYYNQNLYQECERMNTLMNEMKRSLKELDLGLKGELTITSDMEDLSNSLFFDQVNLYTKILIIQTKIS